jgi:hypothetical protein
MSDGTQTPDQISQMIFQAIGNKNIVIAPYHGYVREMCLFIDELSDVSIKKSAGKWHTASNHSAAAQHCVEEIELKV